MIAAALALASMIPSYIQKHRKMQPLVLTFMGFAFIFVGRVTSIETLEVISTVLGGLLVAVSHLINSHYLKQFTKNKS